MRRHRLRGASRPVPLAPDIRHAATVGVAVGPLLDTTTFIETCSSCDTISATMHLPVPIDSVPRKLHGAITRALALRIIEAERRSELISFPKESDLSAQLGVSRTVVREAMKVLVDKGMVEMRPRVGTRSRPRTGWKLLDPDILAWQAELKPDARFLLDLCEVRLAIEPTASRFAARRATEAELAEMARRLTVRQAQPQGAPLETIVDLDWEFFNAVVAASHNPLLMHLNAILHVPFRTTLLYTFRSATTIELALKAQRDLLRALQRRDSVAATKAAERAVGVAILAVEEKLGPQKSTEARGTTLKAPSH